MEWKCSPGFSHGKETVAEEFELVMNTKQLFHWKHWLGEYFSEDRNQIGWNNFSEIPPPPIQTSTWAFQVVLVLKNPPTNAGDSCLIPGSGRSPGEGNGNLLRYFCLGNPMDRGAWWTTVQGGRKRVKNNVETENITHTTKWKEFDIFNN